MGAIALQAAVLGIFLPETKGTATLETMDDMKTKKEQGMALIVNGDGKVEKSDNMESEY
jgi:metallophosphoesterase superfamily enzyme